MIRRLLVVAVLTVAPAIGLAAQEAAVGPVASALEPVKDVGPVQQGRKTTHRFEIRNDGDAVLEITEVKPSCGCTIVEFDARIAAGEIGVVKAVLDTSKFRGPIAKSISVYTNDGENPRIVLVLKADIRTHLEASPAYSRFLTVVGEPVETQVVTVWASDLDDLKIRKVDSPYPFLEVEYRVATQDERRDEGQGTQWRLEFKLAANAPVGPLADRIQVITNHPRQRVLQIPVSGYVRPLLGVTPVVADFGRRELSGPFETSLEIENFSSRKIRVSEVESDLAAVVAEIKEVDEGRLYQLRLTLQPGMPKGPFSGLLTVHTTDPKQPVLEVEVKGTIL